MMDDTHIADGIAVTLLLAGLVVASASVGTLALADATPDAAPEGMVDDVARTPFLLFPIDNVTVAGVAPVAPLAFPIDNATFGGSFTVLTAATDDRHALGQDMDPYALGRDVSARLFLTETPDAPGQDMDPY